MKQILKLVILALVTLGCSPKEYTANVFLEEDTPMYILEKDELTENERSTLYSLDETYYYYNDVDDLKIEVDNDVYNFYIVIPIKTKDNLYEAFHQGSRGVVGSLAWESCLESSVSGFTLLYDTIQDESGYYHYKLYSRSNASASVGILNSIDDLCIFVDVSLGGIEEQYAYTSNILKISGEKLEFILDERGIYHGPLDLNSTQ